MDAVAAYAMRLAQLDYDATVLVTGEAQRTPPPLVRARPPGDSTGAARVFLDHWRPDLVLWMQGGFFGTVFAELGARRIPRLLVDADSRDLALMRNSWLGRSRFSIVGGFVHAIALDEDAAARLRRMGLAEDRIEVLGPLSEGAAPLPGSEDLRETLTQMLGIRPIWFVPGAVLSEVRALAQAYQIAARRSHRLCLVAMPRDRNDTAEMVAALAREGLNTIERDDPDPHFESVQAMVVPDPDELGAWYRMAQVCFMGGTLGVGGGRSPFEAALLGGAVLHGTSIRPWESAYWRLNEAGGARSVRNVEALGTAVADLLAPDRAAAMAHAAWSVLTAGAAVTDRLLELTMDALDDAALR